MNSYIVHGDKIVFNPIAGLGLVVAPTTPFIVTSNVGLATGKKKDLAINTDLQNLRVSATYSNTAGFVGGTGLVTLVKWSNISNKTTKKKQGVLIHGGQGTYKFSVITPAVNPAGVIDPVPIYNGSFTAIPSQFVFTEK